MIVIVTHNGEKHLKNLLNDIKRFNISNNEVCIVDNTSSDSIHLEYLKELKSDEYNILYNPDDSYEVGAYKHAINQLNADFWFFIQDSIRIKTNIFDLVKSKLTDKNIYALLTFPSYKHDWEYDSIFLQNNYQTTSYSCGIFGCNFFSNNKVIQMVKDDWVIPKCKNDSMAMERGLSVVFDKYNIEINGLDTYTPSRVSDVNGYTFFSKIFLGR